MGKKSTPPPPDYRGAAEETAQGNKELIEAQTRANRPNQYTPWGSSTWTEGPGGKWSQNIKLSPQEQAALDSQMGLQQNRSNLAGNMFGRVGKELGPAMNWGKFQPYKADLGTGDQARQQAIDASYGQATSRLDPRFTKARESQEAALRNQGINPGDQAYDEAMAEFGRNENDAYNQAQFSAIREGGAEGSRVFGMNRDSAAFGNTVRQAQISEEMQRRGFSLNEINALISGQQVGMPGMPQFSGAGVSQGPDYLGAAGMGYDASLDAYNARNAGWNSILSSLGPAALAFG